MKDIFIPPFAPSRSVSVADFQQRIDWGLKALGVSDLWQQTTGANSMVFVMDTGIDKNHSDLQCNLLGGLNFTGGPTANWQDNHGHGTHVAGIVAGCANQWGIVGVAPGTLLFACKVLGDDGSGSSEGIAKAINFVIDYKTDKRKVINLSLGSMRYNEALAQAVQRAWEHNIPIIAAAGNDGTRHGEIAYPARLKPVFAVASYNKKGEISNFSQRGDGLDFAAPGESIFSTIPGEQYATYSGTSMATPFVSGVVALMLSLYPDMTVEQVRKKLQSTAVDLNKVGYDAISGWGLIQPKESLQKETEEQKYSIKEALRLVYRSVASIRRKRKPEILHLCELLGIESKKRGTKKYFAELVFQTIIK